MILLPPGVKVHLALGYHRYAQGYRRARLTNTPRTPHGWQSHSRQDNGAVVHCALGCRMVTR